MSDEDAPRTWMFEEKGQPRCPTIVGVASTDKTLEPAGDVRFVNANVMDMRDDATHTSCHA